MRANTTLGRLLTGFDEASLREAARLSNGDPIPRGLCLHVHLPQAGGACSACGPRALEPLDPADALADLVRLQHEAWRFAELFDADRVVVRVQLVGALADEAARAAALTMLATLRQAFTVVDGAQIEVGCLPGATVAQDGVAPDVIGLGVAALSRIGDCLSLTCRNLAAWRSALDAGRLPVSRGAHLPEGDLRLL